jgi:hypothetical protein
MIILLLRFILIINIYLFLLSLDLVNFSLFIYLKAFIYLDLL